MYIAGCHLERARLSPARGRDLPIRWAETSTGQKKDPILSLKIEGARIGQPLRDRLLREAVGLGDRSDRNRVVDVDPPGIEGLAIEFEQCRVFHLIFENF